MEATRDIPVTFRRRRPQRLHSTRGSLRPRGSLTTATTARAAFRRSSRRAATIAAAAAGPGSAGRPAARVTVGPGARLQPPASTAGYSRSRRLPGPTLTDIWPHQSESLASSDTVTGMVQKSFQLLRFPPVTRVNEFYFRCRSGVKRNCYRKMGSVVCMPASNAVLDCETQENTIANSSGWLDARSPGKLRYMDCSAFGFCNTRSHFRFANQMCGRRARSQRK